MNEAHRANRVPEAVGGTHIFRYYLGNAVLTIYTAPITLLMFLVIVFWLEVYKK
jgi:hypothetical protein